MSSLGATLWYQIWKIKTGRPPKDYSTRRWIILDKMLNKFFLTNAIFVNSILQLRSRFRMSKYFPVSWREISDYLLFRKRITVAWISMWKSLCKWIDWSKLCQMLALKKMQKQKSLDDGFEDDLPLLKKERQGS